MLALDDSLAPALVVIPLLHGLDPDPAELRELRSAPGLVDDGVGPRSFAEQQSLVDSPYGEQRHYWKGHFVNEPLGRASSTCCSTARRAPAAAGTS